MVASVTQGTASTGARILGRSAGSMGGKGFHIPGQKPCQCDPQVGSSETSWAQAWIWEHWAQ